MANVAVLFIVMTETTTSITIMTTIAARKNAIATTYSQKIESIVMVIIIAAKDQVWK
jgi:hypothetical protein